MAGMEENPYEAPRAESRPSFSDDSTDTAQLERRIAELERRLSKSWLCGTNILLRVLAVWGYLILGYVILLAIAFPFIALINWLGY